MKKTIHKTLFLLALVPLIVACGTTVERVETDTVIDLSGRWNDTDSRLVSEEMIGDCLSRPWLERFNTDNRGSNPVVIVGTVVNRTNEHIDVGTFSKNLERALLNSGQVDFVASRGEREEVREERLDQASHASEETAKPAGAESGADYMMKGSIHTITDRSGGKRVAYYQVNLELIDLTTNRKAWIGEKKIKKVIEKSRFGP